MNVILKIAGVGLLTAVLNIVLKKFDKDEVATVVTIGGLAVVIALILDLLAGTFDEIRSLFGLY